MIIQSFKLFESSFNIDAICKKFKIEKYTINKNGLVDVNGSVYLSFGKLKKLPIRFGIVNGDFDCSSNELESLEGCPIIIMGNFICSDNNLKSLEFSPREVKKEYNCSKNILISLDGIGFVAETIFCHDNKLVSLKGCEEDIFGIFCSSNNIETLEGSPKIVREDFWINNNKLKSLEGCPEVIGELICRDNNIMDFGSNPLKFREATFGGYNEYNKSGNPICEILDLCEVDSHKEFIEYLIDYDVIRGTKIIKKRLERALEECNQELPEDYELKFINYELI